MSIRNVVQRGSSIYIYDERGHNAAAINAGDKPGEGLKGYTSLTVNVQRGGTIYTYDEKGHMIGSVNA